MIRTAQVTSMHAYIKPEVTHSVSSLWPYHLSFLPAHWSSWNSPEGRRTQLQRNQPTSAYHTSPKVQLWREESPRPSPQTSSLSTYTPIPSASSHLQGTSPVCTGTAPALRRAIAGAHTLLGLLILAADSSENSTLNQLRCGMCSSGSDRSL